MAVQMQMLDGSGGSSESWTGTERSLRLAWSPLLQPWLHENLLMLWCSRMTAHPALLSRWGLASTTCMWRTSLKCTICCT